MLLLIAGSMYIARQDWMVIDRIRVVGTQHVSDTDLRQNVRAHLKGVVWGLYPRSNILLYPQQKIRRGLLNRYPRIARVAFELEDGLDTLQLTITERSPAAVFCASGRRGDRPCYFIDRTGIAYATTSPDRTTPLLITPVPTSDAAITTGGRVPYATSSPSLGAPFLDGAFTTLMKLIDQLRGVGANVTRVTLAPYRDYRFHLQNGGKLIVTLDQSERETVRNLETVLAHTEVPLGLSDTGNTFRTIDLRFGNRVFYTPVGAASTTQVSED